MKNKLFLCFCVFLFSLCGCFPSEPYVQTEDSESEVFISPVATEKPTNTPFPTIVPLSEEDYKFLCSLSYYDDFFVEEQYVGKKVKFHGMISQKNKYTESSTFGIAIEDETERYNLQKEYISCAVMHEMDENSIVPSYFGKSVYLMFPNEHTLVQDDYTTGEKVVVYGEIIRNKSGIFIIPKYIESEEE